MIPTTATPIEEMTNQQMFNLAVVGLHHQGEKAEENNLCRYRTSEGLRCAIGWCISDDHPSLPYLLRSNPVISMAGILFFSAGFARAMQAYLHDSVDLRDGDDFVDDMMRGARQVADMCDLSTDVLRLSQSECTKLLRDGGWIK